MENKRELEFTIMLKVKYAMENGPTVKELNGLLKKNSKYNKHNVKINLQRNFDLFTYNNFGIYFHNNTFYLCL